MHYFIGIDSSTTATKALLIDEQGDVVGVAASEYGYETPRPLWSEQHPGLWWDATVASIRHLLQTTGVAADDIHGIGLTGQMHGLVLLDGAGQVLRPAILWNDQRTGAQCDTIRARLGKQRLIEITGNDALTGFTAPKIVWVQEEEPAIWAQARHILLPKDYVRFKLTGEYAMDKADGAGTILFDLKTRDWSPEVLAALNIPAAYLPPTHEGPAITGYLSHDAAAATGLRIGTPVMAGGGDQAAGAVGVGAVQPGIVGLVAGRLVEEYFRPAVVMEYGETESRASCRSIPQFDITRALDQCADMLVRHGGHAQAAGFTVRNEHLRELRERLTAIAAGELAGRDLRPALRIDKVLEPHEMTLTLAGELKLLEPTGQDNPTPLFAALNLRVVDAQTVGKDGQHLRFMLRDDGSGQVFNAIGFRMGGNGAYRPSLGERVDAAFQLEANTWRGETRLQLRLEDLRPASTE